MGRKCKCGVCGGQIDLAVDKHIEYPIKTYKYIHEKCHGDALLMGPPKVKKSKTTKEEEAFLDYCKQLFGDMADMPSIQKMAKKYIKDFNFTYSGMIGTLEYFYIIQGNSILKSHGRCGIIPYTYEEARAYYEAIEAAVAVNESKDLESWEPMVEVIEIPAPQARPKKNNLLDILKMIGGE